MFVSTCKLLTSKMLHYVHQLAANCLLFEQVVYSSFYIVFFPLETADCWSVIRRYQNIEAVGQKPKQAESC